MTGYKVLAGLLWKDIKIQWKNLIGFQAFLMAVIYVAQTVKSRRIPNPRTPVDAFIFMIYFLMAFFFTDWLIAREKTKGTFVWIRSFSASEYVILGSKFLLYAFEISSLFLIAFVCLSHRSLTFDECTDVILMDAVIVSFGGICLLCRLAFRTKLGHLVPFGLAQAIILSWIAITGKNPLLVAYLDQSFAAAHVRWLASLALLLIYVGTWWGASVYFRSVDAATLRE